MSPSPLPKVNPERESPPWPSRKARPRAGRRRRKKISRYRDRAASSLPLVKKFRGLSGDGSGPKLSLAEFVRGAWHVLEPKTELTWSWHLDIICDVLERVTAGELNRVCINIPPGHMKSLLVSVFWPAWEWTRDPSIRYMTAANAGDLATRDAVRTRQLIEDEWYQEKWGDTVRLAKDQNAKTYFLNTRTGSRRSTSVGAKSTGHRADRLIIDDALTAMDVRFPNRRKHAQDWYRTEFASRLNDAQKSAIVIIGQRLHHDDLFGYIEEYEPEFEWVVLPTEFEPENQLSTCIEDPRTEKGELLFPERMGEAEVELSLIHI